MVKIWTNCEIRFDWFQDMLQPRTDWLVPFFFAAKRSQQDREQNGRDHHRHFCYIAFLDLGRVPLGDSWVEKEQDPSGYVFFHRLQ